MPWMNSNNSSQKRSEETDGFIVETWKSQFTSWWGTKFSDWCLGQSSKHNWNPFLWIINRRSIKCSSSELLCPVGTGVAIFGSWESFHREKKGNEHWTLNDLILLVWIQLILAFIVGHKSFLNTRNLTTNEVLTFEFTAYGIFHLISLPYQMTASDWWILSTEAPNSFMLCTIRVFSRKISSVLLQTMNM